MNQLHRSVVAIHSQLAKAHEGEHIVFIGWDGEPQAIALRCVVGVYQNPELKDLEEDIFDALGKRTRLTAKTQTPAAPTL